MERQRAIHGIGSLAAVLAVLVTMVPAIAAAAAQADASRAPAAEAGREGITVHGDWVIEIREADGTLVRRRAFSNALATSGADGLTALLARQSGVSVGLWTIHLLSSSGAQPCLTAADKLVACSIKEASDLSTGPDIFNTLTVQVPATGPNANRLVLSGNATAAVTTSIGVVDTVNGFTPAGFTRALLGDNAVPVSAGQIIQVTVVISFS